MEQLIIQIARKNKTWGSRRIKGQLKYLGHKVSHATIDNVLKRNGYPCGPDRARQTRWSEFLRSHWESLAAIDFFTTEIYTLTGLIRYMVLVSIHYATRKEEVVGIIQQANAEWMSQMARNLVDHFAGFLKDKKYLIHDRDPLFTKKFREILKAAGKGRSHLPGAAWRASELLPEGRLMERMNMFTLLADPAEGCRGGTPGGWGGKAGRRQRFVGVRDSGGERRHLFGVGEGPAEAVAKQVSTGVERIQFVKKFVSVQWILSCKSLVRPLVYHL